MINFLPKLAVICAKKRNFFAKFFGENILKIITSVPGRPAFKSAETFFAELISSLDRDQGCQMVCF
jgi:hypothetical protein